MKRESSEAFADFALSRIPHHVRISLNDEQYRSIREALIAENKSARHAIDIRVRLPMFFRAFYFVLFCGRDKRRAVYQQELFRINRLPKWVRRSFYILAPGILLFSLSVVILIFIYLIKSHLGIDLFPNTHLGDILPIDLYELSKEPFKGKEPLGL